MFRTLSVTEARFRQDGMERLTEGMRAHHLYAVSLRKQFLNEVGRGMEVEGKLIVAVGKGHQALAEMERKGVGLMEQSIVAKAVHP